MLVVGYVLEVLWWGFDSLVGFIVVGTGGTVGVKGILPYLLIGPKQIRISYK